MSVVDYDEVLLPFLARLIKNLKETPAPDDLEDMKKYKDVKEIKIFFEKSATGASDREVYQAILDHIHGVRREKEEAEKARLAAIEAERKAKEDAERAEREAKEAAARAEREAKEAADRAAREAKEAEERAKREAEEKRLAEIAAKEEAERLAKEEAERKEKELAARCVGKCAQCKKWIEDKEYLENDGTFLHHACLDAFQNATCEPCAQCKKPMTGDFLEVKSATTGETAKVCDGCLDDWKKATRPFCKECGSQILDGALMQAGDDYYHGSCAEKRKTG